MSGYSKDRYDNREVSNALVVVLVGPTAAGKSTLALRLAQRYDMEIVNADAFCQYRGMDIGTAKPTAADRSLVQHHLIDTHEVGQTVDVANYQRQGRAVVQQLWDRGVIPLVTGGSGLYVQALLDDLRFPGTDPQVRARLEDDLARSGSAEMHARLAKVDPAAASAILPSNGRRIVRALEVNEITGRPFTASLGANQSWCRSLRIGWDPGVQAVDDAIARRVQQMWDDGFVQEVEQLAPHMSRTAASAVGYRQIVESLERGEDLDEAKAPTVTATRRLARKQRRWFRRDPRIRWTESVEHVEEMFGTLEA